MSLSACVLLVVCVRGSSTAVRVRVRWETVGNPCSNTTGLLRISTLCCVLHCHTLTCVYDEGRPEVASV